MSYTDDVAHAAKDPTPQSPADGKPREWPLVVGMVGVALAILIALIYGAWWYVAHYMFD
jgi:hypothetical protein